MIFLDSKLFWNLFSNILNQIKQNMLRGQRRKFFNFDFSSRIEKKIKNKQSSMTFRKKSNSSRKIWNLPQRKFRNKAEKSLQWNRPGIIYLVFIVPFSIFDPIKSIKRLTRDQEMNLKIHQFKCLKATLTIPKPIKFPVALFKRL